ncbi:MAG: Uncharacterized protein Greene041679_440, partial [Parcubacteria group bacterium Greene0416_79]
AQYNAFTSQEMTGYFAKSDRKHFATILDVVSDIYLHSTFPAAEMEKEKGVIVEEIKMYEDLPPRHIHDVLLSLLYGDQPAGWDVAGTPDTVRALTREELVGYRDKHYVSRATAVIVAGAIDEKRVEADVRAAFSKMPDGKKHPKTAVREAQKKPALSVLFKETDQMHVAFGIRTFDLFHADLPAMRVATALLGGGMSSRLFQKMRDELGICYYVGASHESFTDHGFLEITAGVPARRLKEAVAAMLHEVRRLKTEKITAAELTRVKEHLVGALYLGLETSDAVADFYGFQEIMRKPLLRPDETAAKIRAVGIGEIARVSLSHFSDSRLNLALIGPVKKQEPIADLLHL